jgi:hypothetical protein
LRVHSHVKLSVLSKGESPAALIELVTAHPKVSKDAINSCYLVQAQYPCDVLKIERKQLKTVIIGCVFAGVGVLIKAKQFTLRPQLI